MGESVKQKSGIFGVSLMFVNVFMKVCHHCSRNEMNTNRVKDVFSITLIGNFYINTEPRVERYVLLHYVLHPHINVCMSLILLSFGKFDVDVVNRSE